MSFLYTGGYRNNLKIPTHPPAPLSISTGKTQGLTVTGILKVVTRITWGRGVSMLVDTYSPTIEQHQ